MSIKVKKIEPQIVEHFDPEGKSLGFLNEIENLDLRVQIAKEAAEGYYLMFEDEKCFITPNGRIIEWPHGLFSQLEILMAELFKLRLPKK